MKFFIDKKIKSSKFLFLVAALFAFCFNIQTSFAKEYYYKNYEVDIKINEDSTFDVAERQIYYLDGSFGFFNRDIATKGTDAITDIQVYDENDKKISISELNINSISGAKHIQWNFTRRNFNQEEKSWTVKYKVHGGISFLKDYDEIYWNAVPQNRDIVIKNVKVTVSLPNNEKFRSDLIQLYSEQTLPENYYFKYDDTQAVFNGKNLKSNTNFTIAVGFSKGIVSQSAYWKDFLMIYYGYILSIIIFLSCIIIGFIYWYKTEKSREGKRAIVPQYEPPQNLKPAMAEVIIKERLTSKGLTATIIDLAIRGYVRIEEVSKKRFEHIVKNIPRIIISSFIMVVIVLISSLKIPVSNSYYNLVYILFPFIGLIIVNVSALIMISPMENRNHDYKIAKIKPYENDPNLEDYEKKYLQALFGSKDYFSTKELKKSPSKSKELYKKMQKVKEEIYKETELDTKAFERGLTIEKKKNVIFGILFFTIFFIAGSVLAIENNQLLILALITIISVIALYTFIKYEARLSDKGIKLKEDWLGFKIYLETAEKYRMQNLKPEYFEKYLPYAMIFGIEKKWAKAFETMNISQPIWYSGNAVVAGHIGATNMASSFSPSAFSASFASSFSSAISNSGASGASGGGGGAGGGGGGGGGGAG